MLRLLARRVGIGLVVIWVVVTLVFVLNFAIPHDVARMVAGRQASASTLAAVRRSLYLDQSLWSQYWHFWDLVVHGQLISYVNHTPVTTLLANAAPPTISLGVGAALLWLAVGTSIGILAARRPRGLADRCATGFALLFYSTPEFVIGLLALWALFYLPTKSGLSLFPPPGYVPLSQGILSWAHALILPWLALALGTAATYSRLTRSSLLDVLGEDYIRTARSKGLTERRVVYRHGMRSAVTPLITQFGIDLATAFSGVIVTESVFGLNGIGSLALHAISNHDTPVIMGVVLLAAVFIVVANIVVDVMYAVVDHRVRTS